MGNLITNLQKEGLNATRPTGRTRNCVISFSTHIRDFQIEQEAQSRGAPSILENASDVFRESRGAVRRQNIWDNLRRDRKEDLAHLLSDVMRPGRDGEDVDSEWSVV